MKQFVLSRLRSGHAERDLTAPGSKLLKQDGGWVQ